MAFVTAGPRIVDLMMKEVGKVVTERGDALCAQRAWAEAVPGHLGTWAPGHTLTRIWCLRRSPGSVRGGLDAACRASDAVRSLVVSQLTSGQRFSGGGGHPQIKLVPKCSFVICSLASQGSPPVRPLGHGKHRFSASDLTSRKVPSVLRGMNSGYPLLEPLYHYTQ